MPKLSDLVSGLVPDGQIKARIDTIEPDETTNGDPQLVFTFTIIDGELAGKERKFWRMLGPKNLWALAQDLVNAGAPDIDLEYNDVDAALKTAAFMRNKVFTFEVGHHSSKTNPSKKYNDFAVAGPTSAESI